MEFFNSLNLTQIKGGTKLKQGDLGSVLSYSLTDENGQEITSFDNKTAYINLVLDDKIWFTTTTLVDISRVTFRIDKAIPIGLYYLEIKIDDYIFPSDRDSIILIEEGSTPYDLKELVPNYDVNMTLKGILSDLSQKGIDITDLKTKMNAIYNNALDDHAEITTARGTHPNLRSRLDEADNKQKQTTAQLAQKANKDEVTNVMTPKGNIAYASLPMTGNSVGWYYYCPDGDGAHGAGNYVWNGTSWYFGGTGDEGYNLLKEDIANIKIDNSFSSLIDKVAEVEGWKLLENGLCIEDSNYKLVKFTVNDGELYEVTGAVSYQFQNNLSVPGTEPSNRIGKTYYTNGIVYAPNGSTHLVLTSELNNVPTVSICNNNQNYYPIWNNNIGGIYISDDKQKIHVTKDGFALKLDNVCYYIAPTDKVTEYEFDNQDYAVCILAIDKTKLSNPNYITTDYLRNNPNEVLTIVDISGNRTFNINRYIPIALWYKTYWEFYGVFKYFEEDYSNSEIDAKIDAIASRSGFINPNVVMFNICSHRGDASKTNNTIEAFESAYQLGYKVIECDLRFTSDGYCVVFHDETINDVAISSMDLATIQSNYNYIPTLTDTLLWAKKHKCAVELDCAGRVSERDILYVYDKCVTYNMHNSVIITAYENELMHLANSNRCNTNVAVSFLNTVPTNDKIDAISDDIKKFNSYFVSINKTYLADDIVSHAHNKSFNVQTWTVTSESEARQLYLTGVDLIIGDVSSYWNL